MAGVRPDSSGGADLGGGAVGARPSLDEEVHRAEADALQAYIAGSSQRAASCELLGIGAEHVWLPSERGLHEAAEQQAREAAAQAAAGAAHQQARPHHGGGGRHVPLPAIPSAVEMSAAAGPDSSDAAVQLDSPRGGGGGGGDAEAPGADAGGSKVTELLAPIAGEQQQLVLSFDALSVWAPVNPKKPSLAKRAWQQCRSRGKAVTNPKRQILHELSGQVRPGEVLALMGPSGSGKTSLLTVLGGRSSMKYKGQVLVNDEPFTKATRKRVGFVLQDDVLYESLTVRETLSYAALLRLPAAMSRADKLARVETVTDALGLRKSRDTIIGGFFRRGISGGERKRVSIGHELLINPAILLLDEPTSGLDSTTAMHLLTLLQDLASGGRAIATTIHQPSSRLYQKLDRLMLLAEGHTLYYGRADKVLDWFGAYGYAIPFGVSIADYILDVSLGEAGYSSSGHTGAPAVRELWEAYEGHQTRGDSHGGLLDSFARGKRQAAAAAVGPRHAPLALPPAGPAAAGGGGGGSNETGCCGKPKREGATYPQQLAVLLQRSSRVRRFEQMTGQHFFQLFAVAFITGLVWWQRGRDFDGGIQAASDVLGLLFFILLFPSMRSLFRSLFSFPNDQRLLLKERPSGMYNLSAYYIAKTASDVPAEMLNTVLFLVITYWFGGLRATAAGFFGMLFSLILVVSVAESWGLLIGGVCMDAQMAQTVTTVLILAFLLVGGYYVRNIPVWIGWIRYLSFLYWGFSLLIKTQFAGVTYYDCATSPCSPVDNAALGLPTDPNGSAWLDVVVLIAMLLVLRIAIYVVLRRKTRVVPRTIDA